MWIWRLPKEVFISFSVWRTTLNVPGRIILWRFGDVSRKWAERRNDE